MDSKIKHIVVIRFSAMGDVVLTVPVLKNLILKNPDIKITVLTRPFFCAFFDGIPEIHCMPIDLKGKYKGFLGLKKLVHELTSSQSIDFVIDLHSVIRSWMIGLFFRLKGIKVYRIDKGRAIKRKMLQGKSFQKLKHTTERYSDVFKKAGFELAKNQTYLDRFSPQKNQKKEINIGIAPFAAHKSKQWGLAKIYEFIEVFSEKHPVTFFLFGGGKEEVEQLDKIAQSYDNVFNVAGRMTFQDEIRKISEMSVFISMDSGNMHIATLAGIPVVSVWGGTHPNFGFSGLYQPAENHIQIPKEILPCRPCSVFGSATCTHPTPFACMENISPLMVMQRVEKIIGLN